MIQIYPNPLLVESDLHIHFNLKQAGTLTFQLITADGIVKQNSHHFYPVGAHFLTMKMPDTNGIYFLEIGWNEKVLVTEKVIVGDE